jgi:hypothetical protein
MNYVAVEEIANLEEGEQAYQLTGSPGDGEYVAVSVTSEPKFDGDGAFVCIHWCVVGRWIDEDGQPQQYPAHHSPVKARHTLSDKSGEWARKDATDLLLNGVQDGKPKPLPSAMRRAIQAAQAMRQAS